MNCEVFVLEMEDFIALHIGEDWKGQLDLSWRYRTLLVADREDLPLAFADFGSIGSFDCEVVSA